MVSGLAEQDFTNYYNRLFGLSQLGEQAAAGGSPSAIAAGNSANQAGLTQAGIYGNAAQGVGNALNNYQNQSLYSARTNALMPSAGSTNNAVVSGTDYSRPSSRLLSSITSHVPVHFDPSEPVSERSL